MIPEHEELIDTKQSVTRNIEDVSNSFTTILGKCLTKSISKIEKKFPMIYRGISMEFEGIKNFGFIGNITNSGEYVTLPTLTRNAIDEHSVCNKNNSVDVTLYKHGDLLVNMPQELFFKGFIHYKKLEEQGYDIKQVQRDIAFINHSYLNSDINKPSNKFTLTERLEIESKLARDSLELGLKDLVRSSKIKVSNGLDSFYNFLESNGN